MPGSPAMQSAEPAAGARLALIIATGSYSDLQLSQLRAPAADAKNLAEVLADPAIGGFAVTTVLDQPAQEIRLAVEGFLAGRSTGDLVLVYVSCHGVLNDRRRLYFAATDTRKDRLGSTGIESAWILDQLEQCRARRQVLILDSCFSGAFAQGTKGESGLGLKDRFLGSGRGRVVLTASSAIEYSFEGKPSDGSAPGGSVFTAALVHGLRTGDADTDRDGHVSVDDAYAYVFDQVRAVGAAQTPQRWLIGGEGRIQLALAPADPGITPADLPPGLRRDLKSGDHRIRMAAVDELGTWLAGDPAHGLTARRLLEEIADTGPPDVTGAARAALSGGTAAPSASPAAPLSQRVPRGLPRGDLPPSASTTFPSFRVESDRSWLSGPIRRLAFSPDSGLLASADGGGTARVWNAATGYRLRTLYCGPGDVCDVAFSPDGRLLATGHLGRVRLWDPETGEPAGVLGFRGIRRLAAPGLRCMAFTPNGHLLLATASSSGTVSLWDPETGEPAGVLGFRGIRRLAALGLRCMAFSPNGQVLATAGRFARLRLWDPASGKLLHDVHGGNAVVNGIAFSPDGQLLATAGSAGTVDLWDPATGLLKRTLARHMAILAHIRDVAFSPDGNLLAIAGSDKTVRLLDPATDTCLLTLTGHARKVNRVAFSPDGRLLATTSRDRTLRVWR